MASSKIKPTKALHHYTSQSRRGFSSSSLAISTCCKKGSIPVKRINVHYNISSIKAGKHKMEHCSDG